MDCLDLLTQVQREFVARGLSVQIANSKDDFKKALIAQSAMENTEGKNKIIVVNIQKFQDDSRVVK